MNDTQIWKKMYTFRVLAMVDFLKSPWNTKVFTMSKLQESLWDFTLVLSLEQNRWIVKYRTAIVQLEENIRTFYLYTEETYEFAKKKRKEMETYQT